MQMLIDFLVVWRLTHMLAREDGPWDIFFNIKRWLKSGFWFDLTKCFMCLSVWLGLLVSVTRLAINWLYTPNRLVAADVATVIMYGFALSGAAILAQLFTGDR